MKAKKENKTYRVTSDLEKQRYLKEGFDIYDDEGKLLEYSPLKKIAYSEYAKAKAENEELKVRIAELKTRIAELETGQEGKTKNARKVSE